MGGNLWLFKSLVSMILSNDAATDAIQRTTTAVTIVEAGIKANVIPRKARALVNHRIHPADNIDDVVAYDNTAIDDSRVKVTLLPGSFSYKSITVQLRFHAIQNHRQ